MQTDMQKLIDRVRHFIKSADAILITAGAGMGVDSGLPDFRGNEGFWKAYPAIRHLKKSFEKMANPQRLKTDSKLINSFLVLMNFAYDLIPHRYKQHHLLFYNISRMGIVSTVVCSIRQFLMYTCENIQ